MITWWRLVGSPAADIDLAVARWSPGLARSPGSVWVSVASADLPALRRDLALVGIGMLEDARSDPSPGLVLTLASDLHPTAVPAVETLALACLPLGDATRKVLGSSLLRRVARRYRVPRERACRELLRERDELLAWDRRVWLPAGALRAAGVRGRFRPVIFDREALSSPRRGGLVRASEGAITRWAFA